MVLTNLERLYGRKFLDKQKVTLNKMSEKKWLPLLLAGEDEGSQLWRNQFDKYLELAFRHGVVDDNLRKRLMFQNWARFQQTHQELMCAYFFENELEFPIQFSPKGKGTSILDFAAISPTSDRLFVEVKTVFREHPSGVWMGDDREQIKKAFQSATKQLKADNEIINLIVITGQLRDWLSSPGSGIIETLYGEQFLTFSVGNTSADANFQTRLKPSGKFQPKANTRVSAVATLEDVIQCPFLDSIVTHIESNRTTSIDDSLPMHEFHFRFQIYHNPYAKKRLDENLFSKYPQYIHNIELNKMGWLGK